VKIISEPGTTLAVSRSRKYRNLRRATQPYTPKYSILHNNCHENLKSYIALTGWALYLRRNMFHVKYELVSYIPEDAFFIVTA
jgi:hypothetical protein